MSEAVLVGASTLNYNVQLKWSEGASTLAAGTCTTITDSTFVLFNIKKRVRKIVTLDRGYWGVLGPYEKLNLIYHELGHCALGKPHNNSLATVDGEVIPASLMNDTIDGGSYLRAFQDHYQYYMTEFWGKPLPVAN